jgi:hypothetical protein
MLAGPGISEHPGASVVQELLESSREARDLPPLRQHPPLAAPPLCPAHH